MKFSDVQRELIFEVAHQLTGSSRSFRAEVIIHNVAARMRFTGITSLTDYFEHALASSEELQELISAVTIHTTHWFRDPAQLAELERHLEDVVQGLPRHSCLRILSAGCSSGQEVYTLALICERIRVRTLDRAFDFEIVGCDIDPVNLQIGRLGQYESHSSTQTFTEMDWGWFQLKTSEAEGLFEVKSGLKSKTSFKTSNLLKNDSYLQHRFDVCVCRNVLIYFDATGVRTILDNLRTYLKPDGILVLGAGEAVSLPFSGASSLGHGIFRVAQGPTVQQHRETPNSSAPSPAYVAGIGPARRARKGSLKIVAVDDAPEMLELYKEYCDTISSSDLDLRTFTDPSSGLAYIKGTPGTIDLVFVDFEMPKMNGSQFLVELRRINAAIPCVLVSGHGGRSTFSGTSGFEDMLAKPVDIESFEKCIHMLAGTNKSPAPSHKNKIPDAILIGASTGGPPLLEGLLRNLSPAVPPIVLVQHLSADFSPSFARQLRDASGLALGSTDGITPLRHGHLYLSMVEQHLRLAVHNGHLVAKAAGKIPVHGQCPAVDPLFESAAALQGKFHFWAGLFTGMGRDGGDGLLRLRQAGAWTFAQDQETSVVYGMPKFARELGAACNEGPPQEFRVKLETAITLLTKAKAG